MVQARVEPGPISPDIQAATAVIGLNVDPGGYVARERLVDLREERVLGIDDLGPGPLYGGTHTVGL